MEECPVEINTNELRHVALVLSALDEKLSIKFNFFISRNNFIEFLNFEMDVLEDFLVTGSRTLHSIVEDKTSKMDRVRMYREYKEKLDLFLEALDEVKFLMRLNGRLPHYLEKVYFALLSFDSKLNCDWRAIVTTYIKRSFQFHNLIFFGEKAVTAPVVSFFALGRVLNFSFQSSEESRQVMLKLTSSKPVKEFTYLQILQFRKPPF